MRISGFTMGKNAHKLYYPMKQAVLSVLPIVDEFIVVLGDDDPDDQTRTEVESIGSDKVKVHQTTWDIEKYPRGMEHAHQTDIAKELCSGDWLLYLQADEVIHEDDLPVIERRCQELLDDREVEGLLFDYLHFWGDYQHFHWSHGWYKNEIRIVRNDPEIHSWQSAQSFRRIPDFDGLDYRRKEGTHKLKVARANARIFHYGWVRPPDRMKRKTKTFMTNHKGVAAVAEMERKNLFAFDYGPLDKLRRFEESHPAVMKEWIARFDWADQLQQTGPRRRDRPPAKHEQLRYRLITLLENHVFGRPLFEFENFVLLDR